MKNHTFPQMCKVCMAFLVIRLIYAFTVKMVKG